MVLNSNSFESIENGAESGIIPCQHTLILLKIFINTLKMLPEDELTVTILSEKHICDSCRGVVEQFKTAFPKATVNIISGNLPVNVKYLNICIVPSGAVLLLYKKCKERIERK